MVARVPLPPAKPDWVPETQYSFSFPQDILFPTPQSHFEPPLTLSLRNRNPSKHPDMNCTRFYPPPSICFLPLGKGLFNSSRSDKFPFGTPRGKTTTNIHLTNGPSETALQKVGIHPPLFGLATTTIFGSRLLGVHFSKRRPRETRHIPLSWHLYCTVPTMGLGQPACKSSASSIS